MRKFLKWFAIVVVLLLGGLAAWYYLWPRPERRALSTLPPDAVIIAETADPIGAYKTIAKSKLWKHLLSNPDFRELDQDIRTFDETLQQNDLLFSLLGRRYLTLSIHKTGPKDFDFLYVVDLENASKLSGLIDELQNTVANAGWSMTKTNFREFDVYALKETGTTDVIYVSLKDNLALASYTRKLVERALEVPDTTELTRNPHFIQLHEAADESAPFNLYVNCQRLDNFLDIWSNEGDTPGSMLGVLGGTMSFLGLGLNWQDEQFGLAGRLYLRDSANSYLHALLKQDAGKRYAHQVISLRAGIYTSLCFDDFLKTYDELEAAYALSDPSWNETQSDIQRVERYMDINIRDDFMAWIGNEIGIVLAESKLPEKPADKFIVIHTRDLEVAQNGLERMMKKIRRRTPGRFDEMDYEEFKIYEFRLKGFFKLFLGKMFEGYDMPYFTYIEDFVVFGTDLEGLQFLLDDYKARRTLAESEMYQDFVGQFDRSGHACVYLDMARAHSLLQEYVDAETWSAMQRNKKYLTAFRQIGLQLTGSNREYFNTQLLVNYSALEADDLSLYAEQSEHDTTETESDSVAAELAATPEGVYTIQLPNGLREEFWNDDETRGIRRRFFVLEGVYDGDYREFYKNKKIKVRGTFDEGRRMHQWYYYRRNGDLIRTEYYNDQGNLTRTEAASSD
jgi:hypothetical protein